MVNATVAFIAYFLFRYMTRKATNDDIEEAASSTRDSINTLEAANLQLIVDKAIEARDEFLGIPASDA